MKKIPSNSELCKLDNQNQRLYNQGKISKTAYNIRKNRIHALWSKVVKEKQLLKKLMKQKKMRKT